MSLAPTMVTSQLDHYLQNKTISEHPLLQQLREETHQTQKCFAITISPHEGQLLAWLIRLIGAKRVLELGTFTGYSALNIGFALPEDGSLITCDVNEETSQIAQKYFKLAQLDDRISIQLRPALETLNEWIVSGKRDYFDFIFIDADKENYLNYYEASLKLLHPGGIIAVDNTLWKGWIADDTHQELSTATIREFNSFVAQDPRVSACLIPIADGLTVIQKI